MDERREVRCWEVGEGEEEGVKRFWMERMVGEAPTEIVRGVEAVGEGSAFAAEMQVEISCMSMSMASEGMEPL